MATFNLDKHVILYNPDLIKRSNAKEIYIQILDDLINQFKDCSLNRDFTSLHFIIHYWIRSFWRRAMRYGFQVTYVTYYKTFHEHLTLKAAEEVMKNCQ